MAAPLRRSSFPGVYRRGSRWVAVYRLGGRQRKESARTFDEARAIKLRRDSEAEAERLGPTLHAYALGWVERYAGSGRDTVRGQTREEYRRLLATFAFRYFDGDTRISHSPAPASGRSSNRTASAASQSTGKWS